MSDKPNAGRLIGYLRAIAFYLDKAQQEARNLKGEEPKDKTGAEPKSEAGERFPAQLEVPREGLDQQTAQRQTGDEK
jgi:hypothetical protein